MGAGPRPVGTTAEPGKPARGPDWLGGVLIFGTVSFARVHGLLRRNLDRSVRILSPLLIHALREDEKRKLGARLYDIRGSRPGLPLWPWERRWFEARLPIPPARILVGGVGNGREAEHLCERGYRVDAFDPAPESLATCATRLGKQGRCKVGGFEELADAVLDRKQTVLTPFAAVRYDAVLLGWTSLTHVINDVTVERTLRTCSALAPDGPVLASFWLKGGSPPRDRARQVGAWIGRQLGRVRSAKHHTDGVCFHPAYGFGRTFEKSEIEAFAARCGRATVWEGSAGEFPHATFLPGTKEPG